MLCSAQDNVCLEGRPGKFPTGFQQRVIKCPHTPRKSGQNEENMIALHLENQHGLLNWFTSCMWKRTIFPRVDNGAINAIPCYNVSFILHEQSEELTTPRPSLCSGWWARSCLVRHRDLDKLTELSFDSINQKTIGGLLTSLWRIRILAEKCCSGRLSRGTTHARVLCTSDNVTSDNGTNWIMWQFQWGMNFLILIIIGSCDKYWLMWQGY